VLVLQIWRSPATLRTPHLKGSPVRIFSLLVLIWLLIGAFAAYQRNYFANDPVNCAQLTTVIVTIIAGPLNYAGVNPKINCTVPQPSQ
jgi:hypothetical protein